MLNRNQRNPTYPLKQLATPTSTAVLAAVEGMRVQRLPSRLKMWLTPMRTARQLCCTVELAEVCFRLFSSPDASLISNLHLWRSILRMFGRLAADRWTASSAGWWFCCLVPQDTRMRYSLLDQTEILCVNIGDSQRWMVNDTFHPKDFVHMLEASLKPYVIT